MAKKYDVWVSFGVSMELDDPEDMSEIARKVRPEIIDRINSDSIAECIEEVIPYDDRELPCGNCEDGEYTIDYTYPSQFETITVYKCNTCGSTVSFP